MKAEDLPVLLAFVIFLLLHLKKNCTVQPFIRNAVPLSLIMDGDDKRCDLFIAVVHNKYSRITFNVLQFVSHLARGTKLRKA
jgi:hypothetical protein